MGNIAAEPRFVDAAAGNYHLRPNSPCIDAGTNLSSLITTDLNGEFRPWDGNWDGVAAFDIGAYEFRPSPATLYVSLLSTNPVPPYSTWPTAATNIPDAVDAARAGDTVLVTNGVYAVGSRGTEYDQSRVAVTNAIRLESVNGPAVTTIEGSADDVRCVYLGKNATLSGFTLNDGHAGGRGLYGPHPNGGGVFCESTSSVVSNCVLVSNSAQKEGCTLSGVCGIRFGAGGGAYGGTLYNCTLVGNSSIGGGGAYGSTLYDCTLSGNSEGGAADSTLYNCTLIGNSGGGASGSTLYNCTVTDNAGGGASGNLYNCLITDNGGGSGGFFYGCTVVGNEGGILGWDDGRYWNPSAVFNSIVYYNYSGNYDTNTILNHCCSTPLPTNGVGNITGPPLFVDFGAGDYRLWEGSPCIDAGTNLVGLIVPIQRWNRDWRGRDTVFVLYDHEPTDILGNTRFIDGDFDGRVAWDIGAYEFDSFPPPRFAHGPKLTANGWQLNITGAPNKWVRIQRSTNLQNWEDAWFEWMGSQGVKHLTDSDAGQRMMFYRVIVE